MWPPPEVPDNVPLQKLLGAQKLLQEKQRAEQAQDNSSSASSSAKKQRRVTKQAAPQRAAPEPTGRVSELIRGLLATRNIEMASMDRDAIEKLRVRGSGSFHAMSQQHLWATSQSLADLLQPLTQVIAGPVQVVDLKRVLAALSLPQRGLKSFLVDSVWQAASRERVSGWTTELPRCAGLPSCSPNMKVFS